MDSFRYAWRSWEEDIQLVATARTAVSALQEEKVARSDQGNQFDLGDPFGHFESGYRGSANIEEVFFAALDIL